LVDFAAWLILLLVFVLVFWTYFEPFMRILAPWENGWQGSPSKSEEKMSMRLFGLSSTESMRFSGKSSWQIGFQV